MNPCFLRNQDSWRSPNGAKRIASLKLLLQHIYRFVQSSCISWEKWKLMFFIILQEHQWIQIIHKYAVETFNSSALRWDNILLRAWFLFSIVLPCFLSFSKKLILGFADCGHAAWPYSKTNQLTRPPKAALMWILQEMNSLATGKELAWYALWTQILQV